MKKAALLIMILTVMSKIFGFLREMALAYFHGSGPVTDSFIVAITIPTLFFSFLGVSIRTAFIPIFTSLEENQGTSKAYKFTNNILNILLVLVSILIIVIIIFTEYVILIFASGFDKEAMDMTIFFTRITIFSLYFLIFKNIFIGILHSKNIFWLPALISVPMNIIIVISIVLSANLNLNYLPFGYILASASTVIFLIPLVIKYKFIYSFFLDLSDENIKKALLLVLPVFLTVAVADINEIVDKNFASNIQVGGITYLNYAKRLNKFFFGVITMAVTTSLFPIISRMANNSNIQALKNTVSESLGITLLLVFPATIGVLFFSTEIVALLYGRGEFTYNSIVQTSSILFVYSISLLPKGFQQVFARSFYAFKDTKTPSLISVFSVFVNVGLTTLSYFFTSLGLTGIVIATTISSFVSVTLLALFLKKRIGKLTELFSAVNSLKIIVASMIMGGLSRLVFVQFRANVNINENILIMLTIFGAISLYFFLIWVFKVDEIKIAMKYFKEKFMSN